MPMADSMSPRFINGEEAQRLFAGFYDVDVDKYPEQVNLKAWLGTYYGVYRYDQDSVNPTILDKIKLVNLEVRRVGPVATALSMITGDSSELSCSPNQLLKHDVLVGFPQRTYFEKTVQEYGKDDYAFGIAACVKSFQKKGPEAIKVELWGNLKRKFTEYDAFARACNSLKGRINLT